MARKTTGTGQGGKTYEDRQLASEVRREALSNIKLVLEDSAKIEMWSEYKKQMVLKLASTVLPKLNEHTGADGEAIQVSGLDICVRK